LLQHISVPSHNLQGGYRLCFVLLITSVNRKHNTKHNTKHNIYIHVDWRVVGWSVLKCRESLSNRVSNIIRRYIYIYIYIYIQEESLARGPKLLSIKNYVMEIMIWKFIYTYRERWKTGPAHNRYRNRSPFTSRHTWMRFSKFWNTFSKVSKLTAWKSWRIASLSCSIVRGVFLYTLPFSRPQRKKSAGVRSASPCL